MTNVKAATTSSYEREMWTHVKAEHMTTIRGIALKWKLRRKTRGTEDIDDALWRDEIDFTLFTSSLLKVDVFPVLLVM